jgi:2-hydroxycyclohexanecarboxyl-CoA dehydrogenase
MVRGVEERFGRVDVLVNNVGWTRDALFVEKTRDEWEREVQINLWGMINCTRAVLDGMIARKAGAIVSMGSDAGRMGEFREGVYGACKAGVIALSKSIAREVGKFGIRLNVVCPGMTMPRSDDDIGELSMWTAQENRAWRTPEMQARIAKAYPLRRIGKPEDVAPTVVFLASSAAAFITGQTVSVSGGYTMM